MTQISSTCIKPLLIGIALSSLITTSGNLSAQTEPPTRCAGFGDLHSISLTDWETGIGSWTVDTHSIADPVTFGTPDWAVVGSLPGNRPGMAAFVANLDIGDCGADDEAGVLTLDSPTILIPGGAQVPRISIEHWFETEPGWDGGNVKISINGGPFNIVPADAFEFGPHNDSLFPAFDEFGVDNNTNPLADEEAFTGTLNDNLTGSWMQSRINLLGIAAAGDSIELRFDFGIDSCDGAVGWYVDDVEVYGCAAELPPSDCGNGVIDAGEQCDDGNSFIGDGCSNTCQVEEGWQCTAPTPPGAIADPSFEAGRPNPSWMEVSNNSRGSPICDAATCNTGGGSGPSDGTYWVWLGGAISFREASVAQSIEIPSTVSQLTFDLEIPACDSASDYFEVLIDGNQELQVDGSDPRCGTIGYTPQTVDISAYADGAVHDLEIHSETFSDNGGVSNFFIDVVAMPGSPSECTPIGPSLTLVKEVINNNGGSAVPANWKLTATGPTSFNGNASDWVCVGGTQDDAKTITLAQGESATCTITNDDIDSGFKINAGHSGAWFFPDTAGQGQFIDVVPEEQFMFISWFTYTEPGSDNPFEQHWFTAQGNYSGNTAVLDLFETLGGKFDDPQEVTTTKIGEVTLTFTDCGHGQMTYRLEEEELQGEFPLLRVIPGSDNVCKELSGNTTQAVDINAGMDGAWFEPDTSGQGFFFDVHLDPEDNKFIFVSWFTYGEDTASGQRWLTAQGSFEGSTAEIDVFETTGGSFNDPQEVNTLKVGTMTIDFTDCDNALVTYSLADNGAEGDIAITRVIPGGGALCEEIAGEE